MVFPFPKIVTSKVLSSVCSSVRDNLLWSTPRLALLLRLFTMYTADLIQVFSGFNCFGKPTLTIPIFMVSVTQYQICYTISKIVERLVLIRIVQHGSSNVDQQWAYARYRWGAMARLSWRKVVMTGMKGVMV